MKKIILAAAVVIITAAAFFYGKYSGANLVRDGLVANYPLFKNIVSNNTIEKDSVLTIAANFEEHKSLFDIFGLKTTDSLQFKIPYHAVYGMDLNSKYFRVSQQENLIEVYLPKSYVRTFAINEKSITANNKSIAENLTREQQNEVVKYLNEIILLPLSKDRAAIRIANNKIAESVMWLFIPYKFELKMYFDNQNFELPSVVGLNEDVEKYLKDNFAKEGN
jgi:hypothetical protein